jgi:hypothetical protein
VDDHVVGAVHRGGVTPPAPERLGKLRLADAPNAVEHDDAVEPERRLQLEEDGVAPYE